MSLDDLIKAKSADLKKADKDKKATAKPKAKPKPLIANVKKTPSAGRNARKGGEKKGFVPVDKMKNKQQMKVATSVGKAKASRDAIINQRRGLAPAGKATKAQVNKAIKNQIVKVSTIQTIHFFSLQAHTLSLLSLTIAYLYLISHIISIFSLISLCFPDRSILCILITLIRSM